MWLKGVQAKTRVCETHPGLVFFQASGESLNKGSSFGKRKKARKKQTDRYLEC